MLTQIRPALVSLAVMTGLTGLAYPLTVTAIATGLVPAKARGSLIRRDGQVVGSALIGQAFTGASYLHPRPSASGYNAADTGASNLAPSNAALIRAVAARAAAYRAANGTAPPIDAVTSSASGLDPDISVANALDQASRIARARGADPAVVTRLIAGQIHGPLLGLYGQARVNVLTANLALDGAFPAAPNRQAK